LLSGGHGGISLCTVLPRNIHALASHGSAEMALYYLQRIEALDLLLAFSFPRYSADIMRSYSRDWLASVALLSL